MNLPAKCLRLWRRIVFGPLACLAVLSLLGLDTFRLQAKGGEAYDLIAAVNQLRTANGLPSYKINGALMAAAQAHSEYQAANSTITHTGQGGSDVKSRAVAAGYGGGASIFVVENIAGGGNLTPQQAVQIWQGDSLHLNTMLSPNAQDVGAGVAPGGNMVYYTLVAGYISGDPGNGGSGSPPGPTAPSSSGKPPAAPTSIAFSSVQVSTPGPDGSIVHVVQPGQALWNIAAIYDLNLTDLLGLNGLTENAIIRPGDKLLIKPPDATLTEPTAEETIRVSPSPTQRALETPTAKPATAIAIAEPAGVDNPIMSTFSSPIQMTPSPNSDPLLVLIAILVFGGTALIIIGNFIKRGV